MYQNFFGFKEKPFKLVPNPAYLFLSRNHEEALAHLTYAVSQGEGFMLITGEVGTGKTTLCRAFLENLDPDTEVAYIFNPKLDSLQLLRAVIDEFGISTDAGTLKGLIDALNAFLITEKAKGKNIVLLIDEAQNLSFEVLEQIRLLSNLETTRSKLIQIILVGQPELEEMLNSPRMRQLGQRITLTCSLMPLTYAETRDYIQHRLNIASRKPGVIFPRSAVQAVYRYSKGIPRRINIICDRTLLTAFGLNHRQITAKITRSAVREVSGKSRILLAGRFAGNRKLLIYSTLCTALLFLVLYSPDLFKRQTTIPPAKPLAAGTHTPEIKTPPLPAAFPDPKGASETEPAPPEPIAAPASPASIGSADTGMAAAEKFNTDPSPEKAPDSDFLQPAMLSKPVEPEPPPETPETLEKESKAPAILPVEDFADWLLARRAQITRKAAIASALHRWKEDVDLFPHLDEIDDNPMFFRMAAQHNGFKCQTVADNLELIRKLNLPAVVELMMPDGSSLVYMAVQQMNAETATLAANGLDPVVVNLQQLKTFWTGTALVPWKNFLSCTGVIPKYAPGESVVTLKMMLTDMGFSNIIVNSKYDEITRQTVKKIQAKHGILPDGVVGPLTKIILYNEYGAFSIPHIRTD